jgi:hypothetical protein
MLATTKTIISILHYFMVHLIQREHMLQMRMMQVREGLNNVSAISCLLRTQFERGHKSKCFLSKIL